MAEQSKRSPSSLKAFLSRCVREGYVPGYVSDREPSKNADGSKTLVYEWGEWKMNETWWGNDPFGGVEIVYLNNEPFWMMSYRGHHSEPDGSKGVYPFLHQALQNSPEEMPVRGPREFSPEDSSYVYVNEWQGSLTLFWGREKISRCWTASDVDYPSYYVCRYQGGTIQ